MRNLSITLQLIFTSHIFPLSKLPPTQAHPHNTVCVLFKPSALPAPSLSANSHHVPVHTAHRLPPQISSAHTEKSSSEVKLSSANTPVHPLSTCCLTSLLLLSTSVPYPVLETPCKINSPPEQLVPFDKGQIAAYQITPKLAGLAKANQNASLVCGTGCSTFLIFKLLEYVQIQAQKNSSRINY